MPADFQKLKTYLPTAFLIVICVGLLFSRALLSLGVFALLVSVFIIDVPKFNVKQFFKSPFIIIPCVFLLVTLLDYFRSTDISNWQKEAGITFWWTLISLGTIVLIRTMDFTKIRYVRLIFIFLVSLVDVLSVIQYFNNKAELDALLLQSKHIPVFGGMHHIYFGLINAILLLILISEALAAKKVNESSILFKKLEWVAGAIILISMHILSSRTGLFSFYMVLFVLLFYTAIILENRRKLIGFILMSALLLPVISFSLLPSFRNKISNTVQDLQATREGGKDVNYKSMGMRFEAWKVSVELIQENPLFGAGAGNAEEAMQRQYVKRKSILVTENRIGPHNQFLEMGIKFGLAGIVLLAVMFILIWKIALKQQNPVLLSVTTLLFVSFMLESVLERQHGVVIVYLAFLFCRSEK